MFNDIKLMKQMLNDDLQAARELYPKELSRVTKITYNNRLVRKVGICWHTSLTDLITGAKQRYAVKIEIATKYLPTNSYQTMLDCLLHEIAHAIAVYRYNDKVKHDYRFKQVCNELGCGNQCATAVYSSPIKSIKSIKKEIF